MLQSIDHPEASCRQEPTGMMLSSGTYAVQDRKNKRAAAKKAALSSRVSLLSGITASSSGSSGSGSTITQESVTRPRIRASKANVSLKGKPQRGVGNGTPTMETSSPRKSMGEIDVFSFLDKDQSRVSLVEKKAEDRQGADSNGREYSVHDDSDLESDPRSFHSDSGISLNDAGSDHDSLKVSRASAERLVSLHEEPVPKHRSRTVAEQRHCPKPQPISQTIDDDHPEWYYWAKGSPEEAGSPVAPQIDEDVAAATEEQKASGYDLVASHLSTQNPSDGSLLRPLYRRFERLNHRILLQLQDEIAEMEEDLQYMDRADACELTAQDGKGAAPASRRLDRRCRGSELQARRFELLGRIYLKVEQYNQALSSFQRVVSSTRPAPAKDVERYRKWMAKNQPIVPAEASYLDNETDLLSLAPQNSQPFAQFPSLSQPTALMMAITSSTIALTILFFRIRPGFISRLPVILLLITSAAVMPRLQAPGSLLNLTESRHCLWVYFGVLIFAALVV